MLLKRFSLYKGITIFDDAHLYLSSTKHCNFFSEKPNKLSPKWISILEQCGLNGEVLGLGFKTLGKVLELNCRDGQLTYAFAEAGVFQEFHTVSNNLESLEQVRNNIASLPRKNLLYYLTAKDDYPFRSGYFDLLLGHCVFWKSTNYQNILEKSFSIIDNHGHGKMILYEPVFGAAKEVDVLIQSILQIHEDFALNLFLPKEKKALLNL